MKNRIYLIAILMMIVAATSCKKEDNSPAGSTNSSIAGIITTGSWRVSTFHESNSDLTDNFNGYTFTFSSNGSMAAANSNGTITGTWRIDDSDENEFQMSIGSSQPLTDLARSWMVTSKTNTEIQLSDDDGSSDRILHFTKI